MPKIAGVPVPQGDNSRNESMNQTMPVFSKVPWSKKTCDDTESVAGLTIRNNTGMPPTPYLEQIRTALPYQKFHETATFTPHGDFPRFSNKKSPNQKEHNSKQFLM